MFIRVKNKDNGKRSVQIVESYRRADKVSQRIVRHVGQGIHDSEIDELKKIADAIIVSLKNERKPVFPLFSPEDVYSTLSSKPVTDSVCIGDLKEEQRIITGFTDIFGKLYTDLGFETLLDGNKKSEQWNHILKTCVLARIANPRSKSRTASFLEQDFGIKIPVEKIYRMMDHVFEKESHIKRHIGEQTISLFNNQVDVLFFDVTTLYFESVATDELRDFGFSKDNKFKESQVVLALVTTTNGLPITYKLFPGNIYEGHTLLDIIDELKKSFSVSNILLVADRAMFTTDNLSCMDSAGINYIVAAKLKTLPQTIQKQIVSEDYRAAVVDNELFWIQEIAYTSRRLLVSYSNLRAKKDSADRQRLVDRLMKKVKDNTVSLSAIIPNYGTKKYLTLTEKKVSVNTDKISEDAQWDGLHGIITNMHEKSAVELLTRYRGLWEIEEAFRVNKHDLKMRPIYHWTENRVRAHISICFLAYTLVKQLLHRLAIQYTPMSFEQIRNELAHSQASIMIDVKTKNRYCIPSHVTVNQKKIYQIMGLKRTDIPTKLT